MEILLVLLSFVALFFCVSLFVPLSPTKSILKTAWFIINGRLHFPIDRIGMEVIDHDGKTFTIFREVVVDPPHAQPKQPEAVLILHFHVVNMTVDQNKTYSLLPLPLYIGNPGFRSKLFTINGEYCQSIYEWDTINDADNYLNSMALKTVIMRSVPGSFSYEIQKKEFIEK
jgi:hypothetical protein